MWLRHRHFIELSPGEHNTPPILLILVLVDVRDIPRPTMPLQKQQYIPTWKVLPVVMSRMSLLCWLPSELIIAIAILLDAPSLFCFGSVRPFFDSFFPPFPILPSS